MLCKEMGLNSCGVHRTASKMSSLVEKLGGYIGQVIRKIVGLKRIGGYTFVAKHLNKELWIVTKLKLLALGVLIATSASVAQAESNLTLGAGVGVVEHPYNCLLYTSRCV